MVCDTLKLCTRCKKQKPADQENFFPRGNGKFRSWCKPCSKEFYHNRRMADLPASRAQARQRRFLNEFGIRLTPEQLSRVETAQQCDACGSTTTNAKDKSWYLDHCHWTNKVRGVLCNSCNSALGWARDSTSRLKALIAYLELHHGTGYNAPSKN